MSSAPLIKELRKKALNLLHDSADLFERSIRLLQTGNAEEAEKMQALARSKRTEADSLRELADRLDEKPDQPDDSPPIPDKAHSL
jgi:uncharacterized protein Yka (UPF0111/DUF47 family)